MLDNTPQLREKIVTLFNYRLIPELIHNCDLESKEPFLQKLVELQVAIYDLDHHLETNWNVNTKNLKQYWDEIYRVMSLFDLSGPAQKELCDEIQIYQKRELDLREGLSPARYPIEDLYYYKSCDVRLMRKLIYHHSHNLEEKLPFDSWYEFDLLTEVNDDIEDIFEDLDVYNGNRFLFSVFEFGKMKTYKRYQDFISEIGIKARTKIAQMDLDEDFDLLGKLDVIIVETQDLLSRRLNRLNLGEIMCAKVISRFSQKQSHS